jgi:hypothetical protein
MILENPEIPAMNVFDETRSHYDLLSTVFRNAGFMVTIKPNGLLVYLKNKPVYGWQANQILEAEELETLCSAHYSPRYQGAIVSIKS